MISDITVFHWDPLPEPSRSGDMEFYHCRSRRSYRISALHPGVAEDLLRIESICEVDLLKNAHYMRRNVPFLSLEYVKQGSLLVRQRNRAYELTAGEVFLMQPQIENEFLSGESGCSKISVMITGSMLGAFLQTSGLGSTDVISSPDSRYTERLLLEICELAGEPPDDNSTRNSSLTFELLQSLRIRSNHSELPKLLAALRDELELYPGSDWPQTKMAVRCNCSCAHLGRLFRRYLDTSPRQYLLELRMRQAKRLLADEKLSIKEISMQVGYDSALNFSTGFRKRFGTSPREYRRELSLFANVANFVKG